MRKIIQVVPLIALVLLAASGCSTTAAPAPTLTPLPSLTATVPSAAAATRTPLPTVGAFATATAAATRTPQPSLTPLLPPTNTPPAATLQPTLLPAVATATPTLAPTESNVVVLPDQNISQPPKQIGTLCNDGVTVHKTGPAACAKHGGDLGPVYE